MSIAKQITVRYRAEGHVRFALPETLNNPAISAQIAEGLRQADGVYRIDHYLRQGKLSIRYIEGVTDFQAIARALYQIIAKLKFPEPSCCGGGHIAEAEPQEGLGGWLKAKGQEIKETFTALGIVARSAGKGEPMALSPDKEKFVIDFLTDVLVLYLIRLHWHMILSEWIKRPWFYRGEWMATFYLIFLLVRSKKPK